MPRIKSFAAPHKGLRYIIAKFSNCLGHTDFQDPAQLDELKQLGGEVFILLNDHVHTENEHTLTSLEDKVQGASEHDKADHERLEAVQDALEHRLAAFTGTESADEIHAFYLDFSIFQSQYLEHIFGEETVTELLLQQNFTDEELLQQRVEVMKRIQFPILLLWMKCIIPAQREDESVGMLSGFMANAPKQTFDQVLAAIETEMDAPRFKSLTEKLGVAA